MPRNISDRFRTARQRRAAIAKTTPRAYLGLASRIPRGRRSGTTQQAIRTGGYANPSRMGEMKYIDLSNTLTTSIGAAGFSAANLLNGVVQGSDATTRIGRKIIMRSMLIRMKQRLQATTTGGCAIRVLCVYDKQANATAPAITDILLADDFNAPNNLNNRDRFVTLFDKVLEPLSVAGNVESGIVQYNPINLETMFNSGNAGTVGDITSGSVYLFAAQSGQALVAAPTVIFRSRIRFVDN